jgi:mannose/fructose/N-acetylgalactosamine-specific phosphotransferase system component IIB
MIEVNPHTLKCSHRTKTRINITKIQQNSNNVHKQKPKEPFFFISFNNVNDQRETYSSFPIGKTRRLPV